MGRHSRSRSRSRDHKKKDRKHDEKKHSRKHDEKKHDEKKHKRSDREELDRKRPERFDNRRDDRNMNDNRRDDRDRNDNRRDDRDRNDNRRDDRNNRVQGTVPITGPNKDEIYSKLSDYPLKSRGGNKWSDGPVENVSAEELKLKNSLEDAVADPLTSLQKEQSKLFNTLLDENGEEQSNSKKPQFMPPITLGAGGEMSLKPRGDDKDQKNRTGFSNFGNNSFSYAQGCNPNIINTLNDSSKIKRKIFMPKTNKFNYTGLIIGPKGSNQKR